MVSFGHRACTMVILRVVHITLSVMNLAVTISPDQEIDVAFQRHPNAALLMLLCCEVEAET